MITATYLKGVTIDVIRYNKEILILELRGFTKEDFLMVVNIAGWIDNLISVLTKNPYKVYYEEVDIPNTQFYHKISIKFF